MRSVEIKVRESLICLFWPIIQIFRLIHQISITSWYFVFALATEARWLMVLFMCPLANTSFQTFIGHEAQKVHHFSLCLSDEEILLFILSYRSHSFLNRKTMKKPCFDLIWCLSFLLRLLGCCWAFPDFELSLDSLRDLDSKCQFPQETSPYPLLEATV